MKFNAPPNWPQPPAGWTPPPNWFPDPAWGPAPDGWQFWVEEAQPASSPATTRRRKKKKTSSVLTRLKSIWVSAVSSGSRHWVFGGAGLIVGLLLGVVVGAGASSPVTSVASGSGTVPGAGSADMSFGSTPIETAVEDCGLTDAAGITVGDEGHSVAIQTTGDENT
ncbi:hypothetical protein ACT4S5_17300 [Kocuria oceani]|uniref:hypothetical protein n=1 Tax=Kocuria oceani TaxID=988827 RepID=UPI004036C817